MGSQTGAKVSISLGTSIKNEETDVKKKNKLWRSLLGSKRAPKGVPKETKIGTEASLSFNNVKIAK